jgi:8-oxo-dGTP pyrophosphatase MutT (NUDIX family)
VSVKTLSHAKEKLYNYRPRKKWFRRFIKRSSVALILRENHQGVEVLMIKRADRVGDPWSGHMAFPGGRSESGDFNTLHTARRETWEEIGLDTENHTHYHGRLSDRFTGLRMGRRATVVTPYVFAIKQAPDLTINQEVAEIVWVPLDYLSNTSNRESMLWKRKNKRINLPCYHFNDRRIWGLSLRMLDELLELVYQVKF